MFYKILFSISAIILSVIMTMHVVKYKGAGKKDKEYSEKTEDQKRGDIIQDHFLNFLGCALGWSAVYYLFFYRINIINILDFSDLIIIFFAYVGVTGYLPHLTINKGIKP